jgi:hypothetical protein
MEHNELRFVLEQKACLQLRQLIAAITREVGVAKTTIWRCQIRQILGLCSIAQHAVTLGVSIFDEEPGRGPLDLLTARLICLERHGHLMMRRLYSALAAAEKF